jgi:hypothetical protein
MLIKGTPQNASRLVAGAMLIVLGLVLGVALSGVFVGDPSAGDDPANAPPAKVTAADTGADPKAGAAEVVTGGLRQLQVTISEPDWQVLQDARDRALKQGIIVQDDRELVPVTLAFGDQRATGRVRLKGDWVDHVSTDQWSLRFELDTALQGMRRFSVQNPLTRGFVMEWLVMETAQRVGVLAPRSDYVEVSINGVAKGVYYLEEHFSKELLEAQGRREGPIVRFDESAMWATWLQQGFHKTGQLAPALRRATSFFVADAGGFGEGRLQKSDALNMRLQRALSQVRDLQRIAVSTMDGAPERSLQALRQLEGKTVEDLFVVDKLGKWLAVYTLFRGFHGLTWHQYRFYHDPVLDRLEPIAFDSGANLIEHAGELALMAPDARWFIGSDAVAAAAFQELGRMTEPGWVEALVADLRPRLQQIVAALTRAGFVVPGLDFVQLLDVSVPLQVAALREIVRPVAIVGHFASHVGVRSPSGEDLRTIDVDVWATTQIPTQITGFRFGNGREVAAADALVGVAGEPGSEASITARSDGSVLLPRDGVHVRFRFLGDRRLASLSEIKAIKAAIRDGVASDDKGKVDVSMLFRTAAESADRVKPMVVRRLPGRELLAAGRPQSPTLADALERHAFLRYDFDRRQIRVDAGRHEVDGDLVLPDGVPFYIAAGAELLFDEGCVLLCSHIQVAGTNELPVKFLAKDPARRFGGVLVISATVPSEVRFLEVADATALSRGGWQTSGAVTFYRSPVSFYDCTFRHADCEDVVNVFAARADFARCVFEGGPHDLFDGDFVTGEVVDCRFANSGEDAIDVSGSQLAIRGCSFDAIGDKALSIGEDSEVTADSCQIVTASIAVAAKDRSTVTLVDLAVDAVDHYVFAAYIKKPEFGASKLYAKGLRYGGEGDPKHLAQTGCVVSVEGQEVATRDVDVELLYRQKVLGK